ncbi:hypothetical protein POTOM_000846 [Populus tomentosa]|uniref:AT-hook motif nuclear-localized protein n=1 Tax=Populus tomentosa TaxID=118781 RepID=A0A8X8DGV3_POPTO|nr:hypothetical protein POTOM_000846 [Populus tomentosa]
MDGREAMPFSSGSSPYHIHRGSGFLGPGYGSQHGVSHPPPGFRSLSNPQLAAQSNVRSGSTVPAFSIEPPDVNFGHGINMAATSEVQVGEPVKKKRGRPRKYGLAGQVSLGLSPLPNKPKPSSGEDSSTPKRNRGRPPGSGRKQQLATLGNYNAGNSHLLNIRNTAGVAFSPHVISIGVGEGRNTSIRIAVLDIEASLMFVQVCVVQYDTCPDIEAFNAFVSLCFVQYVSGLADIVSKLLSFSQQRPRAVCILSGTGTVSSVTLRQPASSGSSITYEGIFEHRMQEEPGNGKVLVEMRKERVDGTQVHLEVPKSNRKSKHLSRSGNASRDRMGHFEILCLSGSYLVAEDGGPRNRTGGVSASLSSPDGHVIGGAIAVLIAASPVQVVVCSFVYGVSKKDKQVSHPINEKDSTSWPDDNLDNLKSVTPTSMPPQSFTSSPTSIWPGPRPVDMRNPHTDIDLTRG